MSKKLGLNELREMFLSFFETKGHLRLPSFSLIPQNDGHFIWTLDHNGSQLEKLTGQIGTMEEALAQTEWETDRVLHLKIEELTQWLFGYRIPEAVKQYAGAEQIDVLSRIFLDEVV